MNEVKSGYLTTEFWTVLVTQVITFLVLLGIVNSADQVLLVDSAAKIVAGVGTVTTNALVVWQYIKSRTELKATFKRLN